jgi:hypothetical protein
VSVHDAARVALLLFIQAPQAFRLFVQACLIFGGNFCNRGHAAFF